METTPTNVRLAYAMPSFGLAMIGIPVSVLVPSVCNLLAIVVTLLYLISGEAHARIRSATGRQQAG
jgi:hypothetical protein